MDNNCNSSVDDLDQDGDGYYACTNDCNDANPSIRPGALEICNSSVDNCNALVDEDAAGLDSDGDVVHDACDNCRFAVNPSQANTDHDRIGNSCDNCLALYNPGQEDGDADQRGNTCDNCPTEANTPQDDSDADRVGDVCDNCLFIPNGDQADLDTDLEGDQCDLDDGLILLDLIDPVGVEYQLEQGYDAFNVYRAALGVLRSVGQYTQDALAVPDAAQFCYETSGSVYDPSGPAPGGIVFYLVTGVGPTGESNLGCSTSTRFELPVDLIVIDHWASTARAASGRTTTPARSAPPSSSPPQSPP